MAAGHCGCCIGPFCCELRNLIPITGSLFSTANYTGMHLRAYGRMCFLRDLRQFRLVTYALAYVIQ